MISDIDWNKQWQVQRKAQSWRGKSADDWDRRSTSFVKRHSRSPFTNKFLDLLDLPTSSTLLDIGCGPGNLTLPLARKVDTVTAVDFSAQMLHHLSEQAKQSGIKNISTKQLSWQDDWTGEITPHDVVLASRSLAVDDLKGAIEKMNTYCKHQAIIVERVGSTPFDPEIYKAIGRPFNAGPDYIYIINILYSLGVHPSVDYITLSKTTLFESKLDALESCLWMLEEMTEKEKHLLDTHINSRLQQNSKGLWQLSKKNAPQWAVIRWAII